MDGSSISTGNPVNSLIVLIRTLETSWSIPPPSCPGFLVFMAGSLSSVILTAEVLRVLDSIKGLFLSCMERHISFSVLTDPILSLVNPWQEGIFLSSSEIISTFFIESMPRSDSISIYISSISTGKPVKRLIISNKIGSITVSTA